MSSFHSTAISIFSTLPVSNPDEGGEAWKRCQFWFLYPIYMAIQSVYNKSFHIGQGNQGFRQLVGSFRNCYILSLDVLR